MQHVDNGHILSRSYTVSSSTHGCTSLQYSFWLTGLTSVLTGFRICSFLSLSLQVYSLQLPIHLLLVHLPLSLPLSLLLLLPPQAKTLLLLLPHHHSLATPLQP